MARQRRRRRDWGRPVVNVALLVVALIVVLPAARAWADSSLVGEWHLDTIDNCDNCVTPDSSGYGDSLTVLSGVTTVPGRFDQAFDLSGGSTAAATHPETATLEPPDQLTVMAWVKGSLPSSPDQYLVAQGGNGDGSVNDGTCTTSSYALYTGGSQGLLFYVTAGNQAFPSPDAGPGIWDGNWHAVAGTYDGSTVRLYVDGTEVGTGTPASGSIDYVKDVTQFELGRYPACTGYQYQNQLDEVRVYDRALSASEISYLQDASATTPPELPSSGPDVITSSATSISDTGATLNGTVNPTGAPVTDCHFDYGTSPNYGSTMPCANDPGSGTSPVAVSAPLSGLQPNTTYDFRLEATTVGGTNIAANERFTTPPAPPVINLTHLGQSNVLPGALELSTGGSNPGTGHIVNYEWSIQGDGAPHPTGCGSSPDMSFAANKAGVYQLAVTAVNSAGLSSTAHTSVSFPSSLVGGSGSGAPGRGAWALTCSTQRPNFPRCVTLFQFGIIDASAYPNCFTITRSHIPPGAAQDAPQSAHFTPTATPESIYYHDVATVRGPVDLNGLSLALPDSHVSTLDTLGTIDFGSVDLEAAKYTLVRVPLSLTLTAWDYRDTQQIGDVGVGSGSHIFDGLPLGANVSLSLGYQKSVMAAEVSLPSFLSLADGGRATLSGTLTVSNSAPDSYTLHAGFDELDIGPLRITNASVDYVQSTDTLKIGGNIEIGGAEVQMTPVPPNGVILQHGAFKSGGANFVFPDCCEPEIFPGVDLKAIGAALALNPTVLRGSGELDVLGLATVNAQLLTAFPSGGAPFTLTSDWLPDIPSSLDGTTFYSSPLVGVSGDVTVTVPIIGDLTLGKGYLVYADPGYLWAGGGVDFNIFGGFLKWGGHLDGAFNSQTHAFNIEGHVYGSIADVLSGSLNAVVSSQGAGGCADIDGVSVGGGVQWARVSRPYIYPWGCVFERFTEDHVFGAADVARARAGQSFTVHIGSGAPTQVIRLNGNTGAPSIQVTGPGGVKLTSPSGAGLTHSGSVAIVRSLKLRLTEVGLRDPAPGTYTIRTLPGSPAISTVWTALAPPPARMTGRVVGSGARRTLIYNVGSRPDQTVTVFEVNSAGLRRQIGTITGGGSGRLSFTATPDRGQQRIVAVFALHGIPVPGETITVAKLTPPSLVPLARPGGLRAKRGRTALVVSWHAVRGAAGYDAIVRQLTRGARVIVVKPATRRISVSGLDSRSGGTVTVLALNSAHVRGAPATVGFPR